MINGTSTLFATCTDTYKHNGNIINWIAENNIDEYLSVNSFKGYIRKKDKCFELLSFYVDLDIYDSKFMRKHESKIFKYASRMFNFEITKESLENEHMDYYTPFMEYFHEYIKKFIINKSIALGLKRPSKINFSGRGYHVYWNIQARKINDNEYFGMHGQLMQTQYNKIQKIIVKEFKSFGADPNATDISRVLRKVGSINSKSYLECETIYSSNQIAKFSFYAKMYKYNYKQYKKHKSKTSIKQQNYIKNLIIAFDIPIDVLKNEFNLLVTERYCDIDYVSTTEGNSIISKIRRDYAFKSIQSIEYINILLNNCLARKHIKEGNRSIFFYYQGIGFKRQDLSIDDAITNALKINNKIGFPEKEVINSIHSAYEVENLNISKNTILKQLKIPDEDINNCLAGKRLRSKKIQRNFVKLILIKNYSLLNKSDRKLASVFMISKSTINKLKKEIRILRFHQQQILNVIKRHIEQLPNTVSVDFAPIKSDALKL